MDASIELETKAGIPHDAVASAEAGPGPHSAPA